MAVECDKTWVIVLGVYSGILTGAILAYICLIVYKKKILKNKPDKEILNTSTPNEGRVNEGFRLDTISSNKLRGDLEAQRNYRDNASPVIQSPRIETNSTQKQGEDDPEGGGNRATYLEIRADSIEENSSIKSLSSDSVSTLYDDVQSIGSKSKNGRSHRASTSSSIAIFYDARDADSVIIHQEPHPGVNQDDIYQEITEVVQRKSSSESGSSSGSSSVIYDDAKPLSQINSKKKKPAPPIPILKKTTEVVRPLPIISRSSSSSSSVSSKSSIEMRNGNKKPVDLQEELLNARKSISEAPEKYRKESNYLTLDGTVEIDLRGDIEGIIENMGNEPHPDIKRSSSSSSSDSQSPNENIKFERRKSSFSSNTIDELDNDVTSFNDAKGIAIDLGNTSDSESNSSDSNSSSSSSHGSLNIHQPSIEQFPIPQAREKLPPPIIAKDDSESSSDEEENEVGAKDKIHKLHNGLNQTKEKAEASSSSSSDDESNTSSSDEGNDKPDTKSDGKTDAKVVIKERRSSGYGSGILQEPAETIMKFEADTSSDSDGSSPTYQNITKILPPQVPIVQPTNEKTVSSSSSSSSTSSESEEDKVLFPKKDIVRQVTLNSITSSESDVPANEQILEKGYEIQMCTPAIVRSDSESEASTIDHEQVRPRLIKAQAVESLDAAGLQSKRKSSTSSSGSSSSSSSSSNSSDNPPANPLPSSDLSAPRLMLSNDLPSKPIPGPKPVYPPPRQSNSLDARHFRRTRSKSVSSSSSSDSEPSSKQQPYPTLNRPFAKNLNKTDSLSDEFLRKLNKNYQPVYFLRKSNSSTQTSSTTQTTPSLPKKSLSMQV